MSKLPRGLSGKKSINALKMTVEEFIKLLCVSGVRLKDEIYPDGHRIQKTENREQRTEDREQRTEDRGQRTEHSP